VPITSQVNPDALPCRVVFCTGRTGVTKVAQTMGNANASPSVKNKFSAR